MTGRAGRVVDVALIGVLSYYHSSFGQGVIVGLLAAKVLVEIMHGRRWPS